MTNPTVSQDRTDEVLRLVRLERARQEQLQREGKFQFTCADVSVDDFQKMPVLAEEFGEVAKALLHKHGLVTDGGGKLREELIHVAAVAVAWAEALTRPEPVIVDVFDVAEALREADNALEQATLAMEPNRKTTSHTGILLVVIANARATIRGVLNRMDVDE